MHYCVNSDTTSKMLWLLFILPTVVGAQVNRCSNLTSNDTQSFRLLTHSKVSSSYIGFGEIMVDCSGSSPDNSTKAYWIRTTKEGNTSNLSGSEVTHHYRPPIYLWRSELKDAAPPKNKFPLKYQCVVSNNCGATVRSPVITVSYFSFPTFAPFPTSSGCRDLLPKTPKVTYKPNQRKINVSWSYKLENDDTGFRLEWNPIFLSKNLSFFEFNRTARQHVINNLVPFTVYEIRLQVLYGGSCGSLRRQTGVTTLKDYPGFPRNLEASVLNSSSLHMTWSPPMFPNGALLKYRLFWKKVGEDYESADVSNGLSYMITNLSANTNYSVAIMAINDFGDGERTDAIYVLTARVNVAVQNNNLNKKKILLKLETHSPPTTYNGLVPIKLYCTGVGDNSTIVYWRRDNLKGNIVMLNSSKVTYNSPSGKFNWQATLEESAAMYDPPYNYQCVASNQFGDKVKSPMISVKFDQILFPVVKQVCKNGGKKMVIIDVEPGQRSVEITWDYKPGPGDTGFRLMFNKVGSIEESITEFNFNRTVEEHVINNLVPYTKYNVSLQVVYGKCRSEDVSVLFETLDDYASFPRSIKTTVISSSAVNLTWLPPQSPNGQLIEYQIFWTRTDIYEPSKTVTVLHDRYFVMIDNLVPNTNYSFEVLVVNSFGNGERTLPTFAKTERVRNTSTAAKKSKSGAIAGGVVAAIFVLVLILVGLLLFRRRQKQKLHQQSVKSFHEMQGVSHTAHLQPLAGTNHPPLPEPESPQVEKQEEISYIVLVDDWEIFRENLTILEKKLGGGQFGIVKQGLYSKGKSDSQTVAVKMLKKGANESDRSDLLTELKILKEVNKDAHPNVLGLIGACSTTDPLLVVTEFCPGGNLRKFLLNSRVDSDDASPTYINLTSTLTHRQLIKLAVDVTSGMIHLASHKFVHRDLAARNVLIGENDTAKLSDFGLARDIKETEEYVRSNQNLLPVKWMALESLLHGRFTTSSDIWSFGVLLYEITTLGDEPYKGMSPYNIVSHVGSGCRMEKPPHCSEELYTIMRNCWKVDPDERPSFQELHDALYSMLTDDEKSYINVTQMADEGPLRLPIQGKKPSINEASVRYTTA